MSSVRLSDQRRQRVNHLDQANDQENDEEYDQLAADALAEVDTESVEDFEEDGCNFLEQRPLFIQRTIAGKTLTFLIDTGAAKKLCAPSRRPLKCSAC